MTHRRRPRPHACCATMEAAKQRAAFGGAAGCRHGQHCSRQTMLQPAYEKRHPAHTRSELQGSRHTPNRKPHCALGCMYTTFREKRHAMLLKCPAGKAGKRKSTPTRTGVDATGAKSVRVHEQSSLLPLTHSHTQLLKTCYQREGQAEAFAANTAPTGRHHSCSHKTRPACSLSWKSSNLHSMG